MGVDARENPGGPLRLAPAFTFCQAPFLMTLPWMGFPMLAPGSYQMYFQQKISRSEDNGIIKVMKRHACMSNCFSHAQLFVTLWTVAHHASLTMGFFRQEYGSRLPFSSLMKGQIMEKGIFRKALIHIPWRN